MERFNEQYKILYYDIKAILVLWYFNFINKFRTLEWYTHNNFMTCL